jgi:protein-L-isoaspartate(D-aspartate) O-methyltransferase
MSTEFAREQMIHQQIRAWDVLAPRVLELLGQVPRELFVPREYAGVAFADMEVPLGHGERMLAPKLVGRILQAVEAAPGERVLEIGTGSGYLTACLATQTGTVRSLEIHADLAARARANLEAAGIQGTEVIHADAFAPGATGGGTFDVIVLTGSLPEPDERFQRQLALGGRMFVIVGEPPVMDARLVRRVSESEWSTESLLETSVRPLTGAHRPESFSF